ncbi:MAG: hypothetical protein QOE11_3344 [Solirubrobacteraceae bacterium]|nr:hypothetical protein [Solirubrobacteraceae bacterium]
MTALAHPAPAARDVLALRRSLGAPGPSRTAVLYRLYVGVLLGFVVGGTIWETLHDALARFGAGLLTEAGPACLAAGLLGAARFGLWQGPVAFSAPDCSLLLTAPLPRDDLVRPRLRAGLLGGGTLGLLTGALIAAAAAATHRASPAVAVCAVAAAALLGALATAVSWLVEASPRVATALARWSAALVVALGALLAAGLHGGGARDVALWSGPWGWPLVGVAHGTTAGVAAAALALLLAAAAITVASRAAGACPLERFVQRGRTTSSMIASLGSYDLRTTGVIRRRALGAGAERARQAPLPRLPAWLARPALAPARRGLLALRSGGARALVAAALGLGAGAGAATGRPAWAAAGCLAGYLAAAVLLEPARTEVDVPGRAALLLPFALGRLLWLHSLVPAGCLALCALAGACAAAIAGAAAPAAPLAAAELAAPVALVLTLCATLVARRGGRVPLSVIILSMADPTGGMTVVVWFLVGPLAAVTAGSVLVLGPASASGTGAIVAVAIAAGAAGVLAFSLRRSLLRRPATTTD